MEGGRDGCMVGWMDRYSCIINACIRVRTAEMAIAVLGCPMATTRNRVPGAVCGLWCISVSASKFGAKEARSVSSLHLLVYASTRLVCTFRSLAFSDSDSDSDSDSHSHSHSHSHSLSLSLSLSKQYIPCDVYF